MKMRWRCNDCDWIGTSAEFDKVRDPKPGSDMVWDICPECRAADHFTQLCDVPDCQEPSTCGWPSPSGYRRTCWEHGKHNFER